VFSKGPMRSYVKDGKPGYVFSVDLIDADGGEIRATAFNELAETLNQTFQVDQTYYISKGHLKVANKRFNSLNSEFEITLGKETQVSVCDDGEVIRVQYNFVPIEDIANMPKDAVIDVIGIAVEMTPVTDRTMGDRNVKRRTFKLMDSSAVRIETTMWDERADNPGWAENETPIIAIKGAKVTEFNGKSLTLNKGSRIEMNPATEAAQQIVNWYNSQGGEIVSRDLSVERGKGASFTPASYKESTFLDMINGFSDNVTNDFEVKGWISSISDKNTTYASCNQCKKKMQEGMCPAGHSGQPVHRYLVQLSACDVTASAWMGGFDEVGRVMYGISGDEWVNTEIEDPNRKQVIMANATCRPYRFLIKASKETYKDEEKIRYRINRIENIDYIKESMSLIDKLEPHIESKGLF